MVLTRLICLFVLTLLVACGGSGVDDATIPVKKGEYGIKGIPNTPVCDNCYNVKLEKGESSKSNNVITLTEALNTYGDVNIAEAGTYYFDNTLNISNSNVNLYMVNGVVLKPTNDLNYIFLRIRGNSSEGSYVGVYGGEIDMTLIPKTDIQNKGTGISVHGVDNFEVINTYIHTKSKGGDSGITTVNVAYTLLDGVVVEGFADAGVYLNGDVYPYNGEPETIAEIKNSRFEFNSIAITTKRRLTYAHIHHNKMFRNGIDYHSGHTGNNYPGTKALVEHNDLEGAANQVVLSQASKGITLTNNKITVDNNSLTVTHNRKERMLFELQGGEEQDIFENNLIIDIRQNKDNEIQEVTTKALYIGLDNASALSQPAPKPTVNNPNSNLNN